MSAREMLDRHGLQEALWHFAEHRVITVAARLGMLALLAARAADAAEVSRELGLDPLATRKMLDALAACGLLEHHQGRFRLNAELAPLFQPGPADLAAFIQHSHQMYERWGATLESWVRGEEMPRRGPPDPARFGAAMQAIGSHAARDLADGFDVGDARTLLDVGGGFGQYARALLERAPGLSATVVDTEAVVELGREAARDLGDRIAFIGGDYHEVDYGGPHDLVLMANVLHQERPDAAARLVQRGARVLAPGGRLAVLDFKIDPEHHTERLGALFAINMRSFGDTYSAQQIGGWLQQAGLEQVERLDISPHRWVISGRAS